ncbi:hypothetical protein GGI12_004231 [Dipsacomyces acuminosporus]|nr:hypothetical protein GGI12_004231 [Dipsacomyces acuminosporus]
MVQATGETHAPYTALRINDIESPEFLESIVTGLSTYTDQFDSPEVTEDLEQALKHFERGIRYIYKEGEFEDRDNPFALGHEQSGALASNGSMKGAIAIDREGWEPGVLEKVLWDRRKGRSERKKWKRAQERAKRKLQGEGVSDGDGSEASSSTGSSDSSSSSDSSNSASDSSDSDGSSGGSSSEEEGDGAQPTHINKALGSDNVGFRLLSNLGWQQGQGLGAAGEGITEPIRPPTRFSDGRNNNRRGRGGSRGRRGKSTQQASRSAAPAKGDDDNNDISDNDNDDEFELYRKQMSYTYKKTNPRPKRSG